MTKLTRTLATGCVGKDVEGVTRAMLRYLNDGPNWKAFIAALPVVRRTWGPGKTRLAKRCQAKLGRPQTGRIAPGDERALRAAGAFDATADRLLDEYAAAHKPKTPATNLVEPKQGWNSLRRDLWEAFSIGRNRGLTDLGTYNPASRLPSGAPSDHAVYPAVAFDLGFTPATGWNNLKASTYAREMAKRPEVEYVICGDRIWSVSRGWHPYTAGGHEGHVHVSGHRV